MSTITQTTAATVLRALSPQDFQVFGTGYIGYVRPVLVDDKNVYGLYGADGKLLALNDTEELAVMLARHNGLEPMTLQ